MYQCHQQWIPGFTGVMATVDEADSEKKEMIDGDSTHKKRRYNLALAVPSSYRR
jgi:hypothetical protein